MLHCSTSHSERVWLKLCSAPDGQTSEKLKNSDCQISAGKKKKYIYTYRGNQRDHEFSIWKPNAVCCPLFCSSRHLPCKRQWKDSKVMKTCNKSLLLATEQHLSSLHPADGVYVLQDKKPPCSRLGVRPPCPYWPMSNSKEVLNLNNKYIQIFHVL